MAMHSVVMEYRTLGYNGYDIKYSPYFDNRVAVAASANYGLVGNGRSFILRLTGQGIVCDNMSADLPQATKDLLTDLTGSIHLMLCMALLGVRETKTTLL